MNYRIAWKNMDTGRVGVGPAKYTKEEAEALAEELNGDYPGFQHSAVPESDPSPKVATKPTLSERIHEAYQPTTDESPMPFGNFKGTPMKDVPSPYLDWLLGQPNFEENWPAIHAYILRNKNAINQDLERRGRR